MSNLITDDTERYSKAKQPTACAHSQPIFCASRGEQDAHRIFIRRWLFALRQCKTTSRQLVDQFPRLRSAPCWTGTDQGRLPPAKLLTQRNEISVGSASSS